MKISEATLRSWISHSATAFSEAPASTDPFTHLRFQDVLPDELFLRLRDLDLSAVTMQQRPAGVGRAEREQNRFYLTVGRRNFKEIASLAPAFAIAFMLLSDPAIIEALRRRLTDELTIDFGRSDLLFEPSLSLIEDRSGYELLPHTDIPNKAITTLLYLANDGDDVRLGTELFWLREDRWLREPEIMQLRLGRHLFSRSETVPYLPNCGLAFVPSQHTFHGVAELQGKVRRILQYQLSVSNEVARTRRPREFPKGAEATAGAAPE